MNECSSECFVNALVNAFLREVNTMNAFWLFNPLYVKIRYYPKYTTSRKRVCSLKSIHSIHQQRQSIHKSIHKAFIQTFINTEAKN